MGNLYSMIGSPIDRQGGNVWYPENHTAADVDSIAAGLTLAFVVAGVAFIPPWTSYWRWKKRREFLQFSSVFISLFIGAVILECNYGGEWQVSVINTRAQYTAYNGKVVNGSLGLHIGLRGINVTLVGNPIKQQNETINYNEHFNWEWMQGRHSFGPYGGQFAQSFREHELRGCPIPILDVADSFIPDGEYIHWGRYYRTAGYYGHIMLWLAFCAWLVTNVLFLMNVKMGAKGLIVTGWLMLMANILYAGILRYNYNPLLIPFRDGILSPAYGWCFWLCLAVGLFCCVLGILFLMIMNFPKGAKVFFGPEQMETATQSVYIFKHADVTKANGDKKEVELDNMDAPKDDMEMEDNAENESDEEEKVKVEPIKMKTSPKPTKAMKEEDSPKDQTNGKESKGSPVDAVKKKKHVSISTEFEEKKS